MGGVKDDMELGGGEVKKFKNGVGNIGSFPEIGRLATLNQLCKETFKISPSPD